jgi:hypothetical protein
MLAGIFYRKMCPIKRDISDRIVFTPTVFIARWSARLVALYKVMSTLV